MLPVITTQKRWPPTHALTVVQKLFTSWSITCPCWNKNLDPYIMRNLSDDPLLLNCWIGRKPFPQGAKDTVKLLKLSVEYGVSRLIAVRDQLLVAIKPTIEAGQE